MIEVLLDCARVVRARFARKCVPSTVRLCASSGGWGARGLALPTRASGSARELGLAEMQAADVPAWLFLLGPRYRITFPNIYREKQGKGKVAAQRRLDPKSQGRLASRGEM